jgi:hypothetical protein
VIRLVIWEIFGGGGELPTRDAQGDA